ncbi:hypothetical protein HXX76_000693 [Chlamydomonas incerta]|uniref:Uncharacterized protein n=1 Tax=Chlamydomonas incerta TaxID=51695 RepID=A0A836B379_CHLIN|nr:hypothetical protein HXX76_000693 [Chlamydomonas incerta]|eukprot:KAG2446093.1 hypothetical protein HXX76_000693 [Chlamydomonas incerta]
MLSCVRAVSNTRRQGPSRSCSAAQARSTKAAETLGPTGCSDRVAKGAETLGPTGCSDRVAKGWEKRLRVVPSAAPRAGGLCAVGGCSKPAEWAGKCQAHYMQEYRRIKTRR